MRWLMIFSSIVQRLALATRYYLALGYSWHLAWIKAAR